MLNYIVAVNKSKDIIVIDYETDDKNCKPDIGYKEECEEWSTDIKEYMQDDDIFFDVNKAFKEAGLYKVEGNDSMTQAPDGDYYDYKVSKITKLSDLIY